MKLSKLSPAERAFHLRPDDDCANQYVVEASTSRVPSHPSEPIENKTGAINSGSWNH